MSLRFDEFLALVVPTSAAFIVAFNTTTLVQSLQVNVLNPLISLFPGVNGNFAHSKLVLEHAIVNEDGTIEHPEVALQYGLFLTSLITFILILFIVYLFIVATYKASQGRIDGTKKL